MVRTAVLLCAVLLMQAMSVRMLLEHPACWAASADDDADNPCSATSISSDSWPDEALVAQRVIAHPPAPGPHRWGEPALAAAPSPTPDEISHVPKPRLT